MFKSLQQRNSNTATRHILQAGLFLTADTCECLSLRISDVLEYSPTKDAFIQAIGAHNVATLEELEELHMYDFGIFLELMPDEEEKAKLENNIQMALQQQNIELEDAIDLREIRNIKLANQLLKIRRKKKQERDRALQLENIQAQTKSNAQAAQQAAQVEVQKEQALTQSKMQLESHKAQLEAQKMQQEIEAKKQLMEVEFSYNMQLRKADSDNLAQKEKQKKTVKTKELKYKLHNSQSL